MQVLHLNEHDFYNLHTGVHDWRVTVVRWLFIVFNKDLTVFNKDLRVVCATNNCMRYIKGDM